MKHEYTHAPWGMKQSMVQHRRARHTIAAVSSTCTEYAPSGLSVLAVVPTPWRCFGEGRYGVHTAYATFKHHKPLLGHGGNAGMWAVYSSSVELEMNAHFNCVNSAKCCTWCKLWWVKTGVVDVQSP